MSIHSIHLKRVRMTVQLSIIPLGLITFYADQERMVKCGFSVLNYVFGLLLNNNNFKKQTNICLVSFIHKKIHIYFKIHERGSLQFGDFPVYVQKLNLFLLHMLVKTRERGRIRIIKNLIRRFLFTGAKNTSPCKNEVLARQPRRFLNISEVEMQLF